MKVLIAHNRYRSELPSGENDVVAAEMDLLEAAGVSVIPMVETSDRIRGPLALAEAAAGPVYAPRGAPRFHELLKMSKPDLVHLHNVQPLISPMVVRIAHRSGIPVVHTVHNYRHSCLNGLHYRDGRPCTLCLGKRFAGPGIKHGCYRDSRAQSLAAATGLAAHESTWKLVTRNLALTDFMADLLTRSGIPRERISVRPSWCEDPGDLRPPGADALFVGRLDENKGIELLIDAWRRLSPSNPRQLVIAGDGPLRSSVMAAASSDPTIKFLGAVSRQRVSELMRSSGVVCVPSKSFEGFPLVIAEAFSHGRAVIACEGTSAASAVPPGAGWRVASTPAAWAAKLAALDDPTLTATGMASRQHYLEACTPKAALASLLNCYTDVIGGRPCRESS